MKSPMVQNADYIKEEHKSGYTEMKVLQSAAGYYVGTMHWNTQEDFLEEGGGFLGTGQP